MFKSLKNILILFIALTVLFQLAAIWGLFLSSRSIAQSTAYSYRKSAVLKECEALDEYLSRKEMAALSITCGDQLRMYVLGSHAYRNKTYQLMKGLVDNSLLDDALLSVRLELADGTGLTCGDSGMIYPAATGAFFRSSYVVPAPINWMNGKKTAPFVLWQAPVFSTGYYTKSTFKGALYLLFDAEKLFAAYFEGENWAVCSDGMLLAASDGMPRGDAALRLLDEKEGATLKESGQFVLRGEVGRLGLDVVTLSDRARLADGALPYQRWAVLLSGLMLLLGVLATIMLYRALLAPTVDIVRQLKQIGGADKPLTMRESECREYLFLTKNINGMIARLQEHAERELLMRQNLYEANMKRAAEQTIYLQSQINPHFLYNNLECMRGMAAIGDGQAVRTMCTAMAAVYRYGTRGRQLLVTLEDELACLREYEKIIRLRFGEAYHFVYETDGECLSARIPRMTLQPLCENAVLHGLAACVREEYRVTVSARRVDGRVTVFVEDNGAGMERDALDTLNREIERSVADGDEDIQTDRVGVFNIARRIRLLLGAECSLRLENRKEGGLRAVMTLGKI